MTVKKTFHDFGLSEKVVSAIDKKGFEEPTPIQAMVIPAMVHGNSNIIAQAQTGTGKTAAFGIPLLELTDTSAKHVQAVVLVPTRELANQVAEEINSLKSSGSIRIAPIYGGQSIEEQFRRLKKGVHIIVGTPGRVIDHLNRSTLKLDRITHLVLDEADEMLNMGFIEDLEEIMRHTPAEKKTLLFSATMPKRIQDLAQKYMTGYQLLTAKEKQLTTTLTEQIYFEVKKSDKFEALCRLIDIEEEFYSIIFCRTKIDADEIAGHLIDRGYDAEPLHGDISQAQRERTLEKFRKQRINILVATDVAARGIDVSNLTHVINYSLPQDPESYVHRIGRTGRAGKIGTAITFITPHEYHRLMAISRFAGGEIRKSKIPRVNDIIKAKKQKIGNDLKELRDNGLNEQWFNWAKQLLETDAPTEVVASLLAYSFEDELNPEIYGEVQEFGKRGRPLDRQGTTRLFIALGKKDAMDAGKLKSLIRKKARIESNIIHDIEMLDKFSFITVPFEAAEHILKSFKKTGRRALVTRANKKK